MKTKATYCLGRLAQTLLTLALLTLLSGCGNLYTGDEDMYAPDAQQPGAGGSESRTPVMVAFSDPAYNVLTKGIGVIDPDDKSHFSERMHQGTFFIYSFRRDNPNGMNFNVHRADDSYSRYCLVDGSLDEASTEELENLHLSAAQLKEHGKRASYSGNGSFVNWRSKNDIPYYSNQQELDPFSFFAYFYDDAKIGDVQRDAAGIRFDVEVDGSQDLMCAQAVPLSDIIDDVENDRPVDKSFAEMAERLKQLSASELKTMKTYYYSTYTARYNFWPIVRLQHQLAYVKLTFYPAYTRPQDIIYIKSVKLNTVNKGVMTVASYNPQELGTNFNAYPNQRGDLLPRDKENNLIEWVDEQNQCKHKLTLTDADLALPVYSRTPLDGGCLLVPTGNNATLTVETVYYRDGDPNQAVEFNITTDLKDKIVNKDNTGAFLGYGFMKSREYKIRASVYGPQDIQINVEPASWVEGGEIEIDPDKDPELANLP